MRATPRENEPRSRHRARLRAVRILTLVTCSLVLAAAGGCFSTRDAARTGSAAGTAQAEAAKAPMLGAPVHVTSCASARDGRAVATIRVRNDAYRAEDYRVAVGFLARSARATTQVIEHVHLGPGLSVEAQARSARRGSDVTACRILKVTRAGSGS